MSRGASRNASRQLALQVLYAFDLASGVNAPCEQGDVTSADEVFESVAANFDLVGGARVFAKELVGVVVARPGSC